MIRGNRIRVSSLLNTLEKPFNTQVVARAYARKHGMTEQEVINLWDTKRKDSIFAGVFMEDVIVQFYKDYAPSCFIFREGHPYYDATQIDKAFDVVRKERSKNVAVTGVMYGNANVNPNDQLNAELNIIDRYLNSVGVLDIPYNKIINVINECIARNMHSHYPDYLSPPQFQREVTSGKARILGHEIEGHLDLCFTSQHNKDEAMVIELKCAEIKLPPQYNEYFLEPMNEFYKCNVYRYLMQTYLYCKMLQMEGYKKVSGLLLFYSRERGLIHGTMLHLDNHDITLKCPNIFEHLTTDMYRLLYKLQSLIQFDKSDLDENPID